MKRTKGCAGFTLLEVLVTIVVLSIGILVLSAMTVGTIRGLSYSDNLTTATALAQKQIEEIKNAPYDDVIVANYPLEDYGGIVGYQLYRRSVTITDATPEPNTKTVTVNVWWRDDAGATRNVNVSTLIVQW